MPKRSRFTVFVMSLFLLLMLVAPIAAQGGPGTKDFPIRDFGACINLPDFTVVTEPDAFNSLYTVPGLFEIKFAEYLMPLASLPSTGDEIYNAMIALLNTVNAGDYVRVTFDHPQYVSAAVEFTLDGQRMFGMIYRNQDDKLFFLFADKVDDFDMLAIGRAIFAADRSCTPLPGFERPTGQSVENTTGVLLPQADSWIATYPGENHTRCVNGWTHDDSSEVDIQENLGYRSSFENGLPVIISNWNIDSYSGPITFIQNETGEYFSANISHLKEGLPDFVQGVEIRLTVQSPTHMEGQYIAYWLLAGYVQCQTETLFTLIGE